MAINIELSPEKESVLREEAARRNVAITVYAKALLEQTLPEQANGGSRPTTPEGRAEAFREWAEGHDRDTPLLSDEAISRECIYGDRG